jgi:fido (protein-threonine AMPylation protein)
VVFLYCSLLLLATECIMGVVMFQALSKMEAEYDDFGRKEALSTLVADGFKSTTFSSSDLYDAIGAAHDTPAARRPSLGTAAEITKDPRRRLLDVINPIMADTTCLISYDQLLQIHACLLPDGSAEGGVVRSTAAVGYASPRIYRVFLPVGEILGALHDLVAAINTREYWTQRPLLCAYYAFAILVFYIHPFHDGNGRCARLLGNVIAKKLGFPAIFRASDKTIQVPEFLHRVIVTMEIIMNSRRQSRQTRMLSARSKENSSMWF